MPGPALIFALLLARPAHAVWIPNQPAQREYNAAVNALDVGDLRDAEAGFRAVLAQDPACGAARHGLAMTLLREEHATEAATILEGLVRDHPERVEAWTGLSITAFARQDFQRARSAGYEALGHDSGSLEAHAALQEALLRLGNVAEAKTALALGAGELSIADQACFGIQIALEADDPDTITRLLPACSEGSPALAAVIESQVAATGGAVAQAGRLAGEMGMTEVSLIADAMGQYNKGRLVEAQATLDRVLGKRPGRVDARLIRARIRHERGDLPGALEDLELALRGRTWVDVHPTGAMSGIMRKHDEEALDKMIRAGAGRLVRVLVDLGELELAEQRLRALRAELGPLPDLSAAEARLRLARGSAPAAGAALEAILPGAGSLPEVREVAGLLAVQAPEVLGPQTTALLAGSSDWHDPTNLAVGLYKAGADARCIEVAEAALRQGGEEMPLPGRQGLARAGHSCAVRTKDLDRADTFARIAGIDLLPPSARVNHALLLQQADRPDECFEMLDGIKVDDSSLPLVLALRLRALVAVEDLDAAETLARDPRVGASDRYWVGTVLAAADRRGDARTLVAKACPELHGDEGVRCAALLDRLVNGG